MSRAIHQWGEENTEATLHAGVTRTESPVPGADRMSHSAGIEDSGLARVLERCRARDQAAWRSLYDAHFNYVYRLACRLGTPGDEAEDVVHEVFVVVFRKIEAFREGRLTTWLYRITANVVSEHHRRRRVRERFSTLLGWLVGQPPDTPEREAQRNSATRQVGRVLEHMAPKKREVFALFELEGLAGEEIAERLEVPLNTVWTRLYHARKQFLAIATRLGYLDLVGEQQP